MKISAANMESPQFKIQSGSVNIGGKDSESSSYKLNTSLGQSAAGEYNSNGYIVKAGFQYIHSIIPFSFKISNTNVNFGTIYPESPATATTNLTVSFGGAGQYEVTAIEEGPLKTLTGVTFPDATCNGAFNSCTESISEVWNSNSAYGFGYNMSGDDIPLDFLDSSYYRPFSDRTAGESPIVIMNSTNVTLEPASSPINSRSSTVTFKINSSPNQAGGTYQTVINFMATPSY